MNSANSYIKRPLIPASNILPMKAILQELSLESIDRQFASFKYTCFVAPEHIERRIASLLKNLFNTKYGQIDFKYIIEGLLVDPVTHRAEPPYHFRVRKADPDKVLAGDFNLSEKDTYDTLFFAAMNCESDMWARPESMVADYNRLNKPSQSVLYTSLDGSTTLVEADVNDGELFFMICYKRTKPIMFSDCSRFVAFDELTEDENLKRYVIFNLLRNEFVREFPKTYDKQSQYCLSSNVAEHFFIGEGVDAIQYPSVKGLGAYNFAFFGNKANEFLTPICVKFCNLKEHVGERQAYIEVIANGFWQDNKFVWTPPKSKLSDKLLNDPVLEMFLSK
jgi:hypothetical protein